MTKPLPFVLLTSPHLPPAQSTLPHSGTMSDFPTGAVRDANKGKGFPSDIPPVAIRKLAVRFEDGATKYTRGNWMKGIPLSRYIDGITRHTLQLAEGDTSEDHAGAVLWNAACFAWTQEEIDAGRLPEALDDLPFRRKSLGKPTLARTRDVAGFRYHLNDRGEVVDSVAANTDMVPSFGFYADPPTQPA